MRRLLPALTLLTACSGDPAAKPAEGAEACEKPGQQCRIRAGELGVCMRKPQAQDTFECVRQH